MADLALQNYLKAATSRAPGKRQIKPNFEYLNALHGGVDGHESDEDFKGPEASDEEDHSVEDGSESSENNDDEEESESDDPSTSDKNDEEILIIPPDAQSDLQAGIGVPGTSSVAKLVCTCCLNFRESVKDDPVIQCDKCGVAVHEGCYMVEEINEVESQDSTATTEPWFCEPCLFGLKEPPFCELCPNRYGAFKRSDVGGQWVHLVCSLYTPGITFGDVERHTAVSWQEIDHRRFGRKPCEGCTNRIESRTGITTQCEAALCKNYFHITCAQKFGLLINTETENYNELPPLYLLCKKHNPSDHIRPKKEAYARMVQQEEARFVTLKRKLLDERELRKKDKQRENYIKRMQSLEGVTISWPDHDEKERRSRLIQTSARFLEAFAEKAEQSGVEKSEFDKAFLRIPTEHLPPLPPTFTDEFFRYYNHRETRTIPEEEVRLVEAKKRRDLALKEQKHLEQAIITAKDESPGKRQSADVNKVRLTKFYNALTNLGVKKIKKPTTPSPIRSHQPTSSNAIKVLQKPSFTPKTKPNILRKVSPKKIGNLYKTASHPPLLDTSYPFKSMPKLDMNGPSLEQVTQMNGAYSPLLKNSKKPIKTKNRPNVYEKKEAKSRRNTKLDSILKPPELDFYPITKNVSRRESQASIIKSEDIEIKIHECFKCEKSTDQHLLIYCNTCNHHYHLGCLDPPLKKMPKLDKTAIWECSDCAEEEDKKKEAEEEEAAGVEDDPDATIASRKPKRERSLAMLEKRKMEEAETNKAFRRVMSQNRHKKPRISNASALSKTNTNRSPTPKKLHFEEEKQENFENRVEDQNLDQESQEL